ncbi:MAG: ABC transporter permease [Vicinamibacterales bacterium]
MSCRLPRPVVALLRLVVPARLVDGLLAELQDDYRRAGDSRSAVRVRIWLARETLSIVAAFTARAVGRLADGAPHLARDARLVGRGLRQAPLPTATAVVTLAIGLSGLLVAAGLDRAMLRRPLSTTHGEALRRVAVVDAAGGVGFRLAFVEVERIREHLAGRADHAVANLQPALVRVSGGDVQTMIEVVDGRFFELTAPPIALGRGLVAADDRPAAPPVVVIGEALWRRRFAADPHVLGRTVTINRAPFTVVGVSTMLGAASAFGAGVDAWTTLAHGDAVLNPGWRVDREARWFSVFALPVRSVAAVDAGLALAARDLAARDPDRWRDRRLHSLPGTLLTGGQRAGAQAFLAVLVGLATLILAAGAANLGGVLIARGSASARQTAIHLALGAGRLALARRVLVEGALLGGAAGVLALAIYLWARRRVTEIALLPTLALRLDLPLDGRQAAMLLALTAAAGLGIALAPAAATWRASALAALGQSSWVAGGPAASRARRGLVAAQSGISLVLVIVALLFIRTTMSLGEVDLGFPRAGLVALDFDLAPAVEGDEAARLARAAIERVGALPGVTGVAMASRAPVDRSLPTVAVRHEHDETAATATGSLVTEDYFRTVAIPLIAGRPFSRAEGERDDPVAIVDEALGRRLWPEGDVVGRALFIGPERRRVRVVGVARDVRHVALTDRSGGHLYRPVAAGFTLTLLVRGEAEPRRTLADVQRTLDGLGPGLVGFFPRTFDDHLAPELLPARLAAAFSSALGILALLSSGTGLYGLIAWLVQRRRREIGVRMALGASPAAIVRLVVGQALRIAAPGAVGGVLGAAALGVSVRSQLFGVGPLDPGAFAIGVGALAAIVAAAAWAPSAAASRLDPAAVLRDV